MKVKNGSLNVGHWNGSPIKIHWSVFLGALFFGGFTFLPFYWVSFFIVVFIHEAGHVLVIRQFRLTVDEIVIHGFGGYCKWGGHAEAITISMIAWGGVLAQLALLTAAYTALCFFSPPHDAITRQIFHAFIDSNIWMIIFNLIPMKPLDGKEAWKFFGLMRNDYNTYRSERRREKQNDRLKKQLEAIMRQEPDQER